MRTKNILSYYNDVKSQIGQSIKFARRSLTIKQAENSYREACEKLEDFKFYAGCFTEEYRKKQDVKNKIKHLEKMVQQVKQEGEQVI